MNWDWYSEEINRYITLTKRDGKKCLVPFPYTLEEVDDDTGKYTIITLQNGKLFEVKENFDSICKVMFKENKRA